MQLPGKQPPALVFIASAWRCTTNCDDLMKMKVVKWCRVNYTVIRAAFWHFLPPEAVKNHPQTLLRPEIGCIGDHVNT